MVQGETLQSATLEIESYQAIRKFDDLEARIETFALFQCGVASEMIVFCVIHNESRQTAEACHFVNSKFCQLLDVLDVLDVRSSRTRARCLVPFSAVRESVWISLVDASTVAVQSFQSTKFDLKSI